MKVAQLALSILVIVSTINCSYAETAKRPTRSVADITKAIAEHPTDAALYSERGIAFKRLQQYKESLADFKKAIELKGSDPANDYCGIGASYLGLKEYALAKDAFDRAISIDPKYAYLYDRRGVTLALMDQWTAATADMERAIQLDPNDLDTYVDCGNLYVGAEEFAKAIASLTKVIELNGADAETYRLRGLSFRHLKKFDQSIADFDKSIELKPRATTYLGRGMTYFEQKNYDLALADYDTGIKLDPTEKKFAEAREKALQAKRTSGINSAESETSRTTSQSTRRSDVEDEIISRQIDIAKATPEKVNWLLNGARNQGPTQLAESKIYLKKVRPDLSTYIDNFEKRKIDDAKKEADEADAEMTAKIQHLNPIMAMQLIHRAEDKEWSAMQTPADRGLVLRTKANIKRLRPDLTEVVNQYGKTPEEVERIKLIPMLEPSVLLSKEEKIRIAVRLVKIYEAEGDYFGAVRRVNGLMNMIYPFRDEGLGHKIIELQLKQVQAEQQVQ